MRKTYLLDIPSRLVGVFHCNLNVDFTGWTLLHGLKKGEEISVLSNYVISFVTIQSVPPKDALPFQHLGLLQGLHMDSKVFTILLKKSEHGSLERLPVPVGNCGCPDGVSKCINLFPLFGRAGGFIGGIRRDGEEVIC